MTEPQAWFLYRSTNGIALACWTMLLFTGCQSTVNGFSQGYVEGEFVYVSSPSAGRLVTLKVARGTTVNKGDALYELDDTRELAARDEAQHRLAQARDRLADARKGRRPTEIRSLEAQLEHAKEALKFSEAELARVAKLVKSKASTAEEFDQRLTARNQDQQHVIEMEAELQTAQMGARDDVIAAAEKEVAILSATLRKVEWDLSQMKQVAGQSALVFDVYYRVGEWVPAGRPILSLLPPSQIKVRAFVGETLLGSLQVGQKATVRVDGVKDPYIGRISFISPRAEHTPPVIYSQETRNKLVFLVEIEFDEFIARALHPGQPVDIHWNM